MTDKKPFPAVGSKIRMFFGKGHPNTWLRFGVVLAVVENEARKGKHASTS